MKRLRIGLTALAVALAVGSVAASNAASVHSGDPTYNWITYDQNGSQTGTYANKTQAQMESITGCQPKVTQTCAAAFDALGNEVKSVELHYQ